MTTPEDVEGVGPVEASAERNHVYVIDPAKMEELNRSLALMLQSRRCVSSKARLEASSGTLSEEDHMREIAACCSNEEGFIRPDMPMQEIVFRSILAEGNKPLSLEHLHYLVTDRWYTPVNPRSLSEDSLKKVLDADVYYGFKEVTEEPAGD